MKPPITALLPCTDALVKLSFVRGTGTGQGIVPWHVQRVQSRWHNPQVRWFHMGPHIKEILGVVPSIL